MPSKFRLRYIFSPVVRLIAKGLNKLGITPNFATIIMLSFALLSFFSLTVFLNLILFSIFVFLTGIFDGVDGAIARLTNKITSFGGFFDSIMDRISEFIIFLALLISCWNQLLWNSVDMRLIIFISFLASIMISYIRARAEVISKGDFDVGLLARSERLFFIFISSIIAYFIDILDELLFIFMWLLMGTAIFRFIKINNLIKKQKKGI